jgi:hypothetical protein
METLSPNTTAGSPSGPSKKTILLVEDEALLAMAEYEVLAKRRNPDRSEEKGRRRHITPQDVMKPFVLIAMVLAPVLCSGQELPGFERYFVDSTMRVDLYHVGDKAEEFYTLDRILRGGIWAGTTTNLIDPLNNGRYRARLVEIASNTLIFSRGFDSYFGEYKTTDPAREGTKRVFQETVLCPFPKRPVLLVIDRRDRWNVYQPLFERRIDPSDYHILGDIPQRNDKVVTLLKAGDSHHAVDLVFIGEGYTQAEEKKFEGDLKRCADILFTWEPYKQYKNHFNVTGIFAPSVQSGVDEPRQGSYKRTLLNATFNSLDSDRYLLTEENKLMHDIAGQVPYDAVLVIVNSTRYGGGGIYNAFTAFTSDGPSSDYVFVHEFCHAFGGLGDEYMGDVSYEGFYPKGVEPTDANLTGLLDPEHLKWKDLMSPGLAIPTEWGQATYDSLVARQSELVIARGKIPSQVKVSGPGDSVLRETAAALGKEIGGLSKKITSFLEDHPLKGKVGVFEGGGYEHKGIYRPTVNSLMNQFTKTDRSLYPVSERAVKHVIEYYIQ